MNHFISGALMMGFLVGSFFFLRFWRQTRDRFFAIFAGAFGLLAVERIPLAFMSPENETREFVYLIRLAAFCLILIAILQKNRKSRNAPSEPPQLD